MAENHMCPCGAGPLYSNCCAPFITGSAIPPTAEKLMRSRYSAYALRHIDWIEETCTGTARAHFDRASATQWASRATFTGLKVLRIADGAPNDTTGIVEFEASFSEGGQAQVLRETSLFSREHGRWSYAGAAPPAKAVGRNALCPCGSGKKYKRCCAVWLLGWCPGAAPSQPTQNPKRRG